MFTFVRQSVVVRAVRRRVSGDPGGEAGNGNENGGHYYDDNRFNCTRVSVGRSPGDSEWDLHLIIQLRDMSRSERTNFNQLAN